MAAFASRYAYGPTRVQFEAKNPRGFAVFKQALAGHSALGAVNTQLGCQKERPSLYHLQNEMAGLTVPTLILTGDEGLALPGAGVADEAHHPIGGSLGDAELRAHHPSRKRRTCSTVSSATSWPRSMPVAGPRVTRAPCRTP